MSEIEINSQDSKAREFESRKRDHIRLALNQKNQSVGHSGLDQIRLIHEALPEINFQDISISTVLFKNELSAPFFVSSMTAGHQDGIKINQLLAEVCSERSWAMGVGSQRRELFDSSASKEWKDLRKRYPRLVLMGNLGLSQLIQSSLSQVQELVDSLEASAFIIHTNPLQEVLQNEGTPQFKGGLKALENLCKNISVPVVLKETGCGFSKKTLEQLSSLGLYAVDVSGMGGTHWGRIEGDRALGQSPQHVASQTFGDWGIGTVKSLENALSIPRDFKVWASGGVRSGLDGAKLLAMGAQMVGFAKPILEAALKSETFLHQTMETLEFELKVAMFCTGSVNLDDLQKGRVWEKT